MGSLTKTSRQLQTYDPWRDFFSMDSFLPSEFVRPSRALPAVNISEDDKGYHIDVVAPGFKKEDFKINVDDDVLTISAEAKSESTTDGNNKQYSRREYSYSAFTRSFKLPDNAKDDSINAGYTDGVLKLSIPKSEKQVKATKQISVQ
jgi:HSP20 family protein